MTIMSKYGVVSSCNRGRVDYFKDHFVSDRTWLLRIRPEQGKGLPSIVYFSQDGNTDIWSIIFDGKVSCCWKCGGEGHRGDQCRSVRPKPNDQGQTAPVGLGTWCDVIKEGHREEWMGMASKANLSKQKSLKPVQKKVKPVVTPVQQGPPVMRTPWGQASKQALAIPGSGLYNAFLPGNCKSEWREDKKATNFKLKLSNSFSGLEIEGYSEDMEEEINSGDELELLGVNNPTKKRANSSASARVKSKPRLDLDVINPDTGKETTVGPMGGGTMDVTTVEVQPLEVGVSQRIAEIEEKELPIENGTTAAEEQDEFVVQEGGGVDKSQVGGEGEKSQVGGEGGKSQVGGEGEKSEVGGEGEQSQLGIGGQLLGDSMEGDSQGATGGMGGEGRGPHSQEVVRHVGGFPVKNTGDISLAGMQTGDSAAASLSEIINPLGSDTSPVEKQQKKSLGQSKPNQDGCTK